MARLRVVHVGPDPHGMGGMASVMRGLLDAEQGAAYDRDVIVTYRTAAPVPRLLNFLRATVRLVRWCAGRGPRIVHIHTTVRGSLHRKAVLVALVKLLRRPVILHLHSGAGDIAAFDETIGRVRRALFARAFAAADQVVSVSRAGADEIGRRFGATDVAVVRNAAPAPPGDGDVPLPTSPARLLYLGGFDRPAKGGDVLVEALPGVLEAVPGLEVDVAGIGEPPPAFAALRADGRVHWLGYLDEQGKEDAFARCALFVLPSVSEGIPVALLEAMAHGRAIVATRVGGVPELLTDDVEAVLVPGRDPDALARALAQLAGDPERIARLGAAARQRAARLNDDELWRPLNALYAALAPGAAAGAASGSR
jgi:glycosyltransferase involved in cell wall biosynthesis